MAKMYNITPQKGTKAYRILTRTLSGFAIFLFLIIFSANQKTTTTTTSSNSDTTSSSQSPSPTQTIAKIGEAVRDGKFEFKISSLKCGSTTVGGQYINKTAQGQYCLLDMSVKNIGNEAQSLSSSNQYLYNATGQKYSADDTATAYASNDSSTWYSNINPGNSVQGVIVFDIPKDQTPTKAELHDSSLSGGVVVNL